MTTIRPFTKNDYPAVVEINNLIWLVEPTTVEELSTADQHRDPKCNHERWVAEQDGVIVGTAQYDQLAGRYHPDKYWLEIEVHPDYQRQGIGTALYEQVINGVQAHNPWLARVAFQGNMTAAHHFLERYGYAEEWRSWDWKLDVPNYQPPAEASALLVQLEEEGFEIRTYTELADDPDRSRRLYELHESTRQDAPFPDPATAWPYEAYLATLESGLDPDGYFVAIHKGDYVALSVIEKEDPGEEVDTGWTGVRKDYRGRGLALALKLKVIEYAKEKGHPIIWTTNNSLNYPMMAINQKIGYERDIAWVYYRKFFREETK
ncbi:MAG: GNAT family N-acetyltransferase [Chloroflexota bacterium]